MHRITLFSIIAAFMLFGLSVQHGSVQLDVPLAMADNDNGSNDNGSNDNGSNDNGSNDNGSNDNGSKDDDSYACDCPPGITDCTCADGTAGKASKDKPSAAGPIRFRSF